MTKPIEEMRAWLEEARELAVKERGIFIMTKVEVIDAILAALAEKAELKVTEVFVREWAESIAGDSAINDIRRARGKVESLLRQAGVIILGHAAKESITEEERKELLDHFNEYSPGMPLPQGCEKCNKIRALILGHAAQNGLQITEQERKEMLQLIDDIKNTTEYDWPVAAPLLLDKIRAVIERAR